MTAPIAVPEGWRLVPVECTDEIAEAIADEAHVCGGIAETIWRKALAASPRPDTPADRTLPGERCNCGLPKGSDVEGEHHPFCLFKGPAGGDGGEREAVARIAAAVLWADAQLRLGAPRGKLPRTRTDFHKRADALMDHPALLAHLAPASGEERNTVTVSGRVLPFDSLAELERLIRGGARIEAVSWSAALAQDRG